MITEKKLNKAEQLKDEWIKETQRFQIIARGGEASDSYEDVALEYDAMIAERKKRKRSSKSTLRT